MIQDKLPEIELSFGVFGVRQPTLRGWNDLLAEAEEQIGLDKIKSLLSEIAVDAEKDDDAVAIEDDSDSGIFGKTMSLLLQHIQQFPLLIEKFACVCLRDLETRKPISHEQGEDLTLSDFADLIDFISDKEIFKEMIGKVKNAWGRLLPNTEMAASDQKGSSETSEN